MADRLLIISGDNHAAAQLPSYAPYIDPQYRPALKELEKEESEFFAVTAVRSKFSEEVLNVIDERGAIRGGGHVGGWDVSRRLKELDAEGVAAEIVHGGTGEASMPFFSQVNKPHPIEYRAAGCRAYHRWLADVMSDSDGRMFGVADPGPCHDIPGTVRDLHWLADHRFVSVGVPGNTRDDSLPSLTDSYYEPFWTACEERNLVLSIHAGWGAHQGLFFQFAMMMRGKTEETPERRAAQLQDSADSPLALNLRPRQAFWQLIMSGVFDRHPALKLCLTEVRADWLPATLSWLDRRFEREGIRTKLRPSEYFQRQCYVCPSSPRPPEIAMRDEIGVHRFLFGIDYPHAESTWPNTLHWMRDVFSGVPENELRLILGENAVQCYGLGREKLLEHADRIGFEAADITSFTGRVPDGLLDNFEARSGYARPAEPFDEPAMERAFRGDLSMAGT
jgi:predicted TIM-barrel fold metal-dependent hydrolase